MAKAKRITPVDVSVVEGQVVVEPVAEDTLPPMTASSTGAGPALERGVDSGCDDGAA